MRATRLKMTYARTVARLARCFIGVTIVLVVLPSGGKERTEHVKRAASFVRQLGEEETEMMARCLFPSPSFCFPCAGSLT